MVNDDVIRWRCCQRLSRDFMVYKVKPNVRALDYICLVRRDSGTPTS